MDAHLSASEAYLRSLIQEWRSQEFLQAYSQCTEDGVVEFAGLDEPNAKAFRGRGYCNIVNKTRKVTNTFDPVSGNPEHPLC